MRVRFHEAAMAELAWEVQHYAKISPQLGERFTTAEGCFDSSCCGPVILTFAFSCILKP